MYPKTAVKVVGKGGEKKTVKDASSANKDDKGDFDWDDDM